MNKTILMIVMSLVILTSAGGIYRADAGEQSQSPKSHHVKHAGKHVRKHAKKNSKTVRKHKTARKHARAKKTHRS
jgi:hypothetical protein